MQKLYHVYIDRRLDTNEIIYVGKGNDKRLKTLDRSNKFHRHIRKKHGIKREVVFSTVYETLALINEELLRAKLEADGIKLVNVVKNMQREYRPLDATQEEVRLQKWRKHLNNIIPISQANWRKNAEKARKSIICNETCQEFVSISEAGRVLGIQRQNIQAVLSGRLPHAKKLTFTYKEII